MANGHYIGQLKETFSTSVPSRIAAFFAEPIQVYYFVISIFDCLCITKVAALDIVLPALCMTVFKGSRGCSAVPQKLPEGGLQTRQREGRGLHCR